MLINSDRGHVRQVQIQENLETLCPNMDIVITGLDVCKIFELKGNLIDSTLWNTGETDDIHS